MHENPGASNKLQLPWVIYVRQGVWAKWYERKVKSTWCDLCIKLQILLSINCNPMQTKLITIDLWLSMIWVVILWAIMYPFSWIFYVPSLTRIRFRMLLGYRVSNVRGLILTCHYDTMKWAAILPLLCSRGVSIWPFRCRSTRLRVRGITRGWCSTVKPCEFIARNITSRRRTKWWEVVAPPQLNLDAPALEEETAKEEEGGCRQHEHGTDGSDEIEHWSGPVLRAVGVIVRIGHRVVRAWCGHPVEYMCNAVVLDVPSLFFELTLASTNIERVYNYIPAETTTTALEPEIIPPSRRFESGIHH